MFFQAMDSVRRSQSSDVLTEAEEVSAFLLELAHFFHEWRFTLPDVLILLQVTVVLFVDLNFAWNIKMNKSNLDVCGCMSWQHLFTHLSGKVRNIDFKWG